VSSLKFQKVKDYELAWVDSITKTRSILNENEAQQQNMLAISSNLDLGFSLHPIPKEQIKPHQSVFVNEPKLSDLKQIFLQNAIQAEFHGGVLVCNGTVALKKVKIFKFNN
jgi:cleavage and polyadenylation specificity factor subunit 2